MVLKNAFKRQTCLKIKLKMTINTWTTPSKWENYGILGETGDDLWNLQFARWWGWNWVKKREELFKKQLLKSENVPILNAYYVETNYGNSREMGGSKTFGTMPCGKMDCDYCLRPYKWFYRRFLKFKRKKKIDPVRKKELVGRFLTPCASEASCPCRYFTAFQDNPCTATHMRRSGRVQKACFVEESSSSSSCNVCCCCSEEERLQPICSDCSSSCSGCLCDLSRTRTKKEYINQLVQTFTVDSRDQNSQTFTVADEKYTQTEHIATADENTTVAPIVKEQSCGCTQTKQKRHAQKEKKHRHCCRCRKIIETKHCCMCNTINRQHHCCQCQRNATLMQQNQNSRCVSAQTTIKYVATKETQANTARNAATGAGDVKQNLNQTCLNVNRNATVEGKLFV